MAEVRGLLELFNAFCLGILAILLFVKPVFLGGDEDYWNYLESFPGI